MIGLWRQAAVPGAAKFPLGRGAQAHFRLVNGLKPNLALWHVA